MSKKKDEINVQCFSKRKPFRPNHNEVFGLERDYGPAHGLRVGEINMEDPEFDKEE